jgi:hypothetical protein
MTTYLLLLLSTALVNNVVLVKFLGLCPFMGVSRNLDSALGMGLATTFVITLACAATWLLEHWLLAPFDLGYLRTLAFIVVIAAIVQLTELIIQKTSPLLHDGGDGDDEGQGAQVLQPEGNEQGVVDDVAGPRGHGEHEGGRGPHAVGGFQLFGNAHEGAQAENLHQHDVVDQHRADEDEKVMAHEWGKGGRPVLSGFGSGQTTARRIRV